ncbi:energy transducer TonB [Ideonella azotifigens]|uniref:TonB C-terminal domain-containing protein n=1 Tax=Ideonella azotifigens TaxID=513160 RepID=A0ABP3VW87_9BURK|nr:TonB family protein [Ideonella azotifigens]MCD2343504.1 energy transducer TonB [Ideonella azotifigens]
MSMVFSEDPQKSGQRSYTGLAVVAGLHVVLGYALLNGLGQVVVDVLKPPVDVQLFKEIQPPPPPPPPPQLPQPKTPPPPQSFAPMPEVPVVPQPVQQSISTTPVQPPPGPVTLAPAPAPPAPPAPPRVAARPAIGNISACAPAGADYPAAASRAEATGTTRVRFTVDAAGQLAKADVVKSAGPSREHRLLDRIALDKLSGCTFKAGVDENGQPAGGTFEVEYLWKLE